ncbi:ABC transporter substrate-binding protein [Algoriphagus sp. CAU 1675]|uniref:ABC transporter substrate-binding protein n=1 Tax=Algoriphagus sp. CAU 1675 TaxID=3032597 RepID=UPI0023DA92A7|nr:ABC transporter substrate-binding protein [Algoriphagus sp. CAU 1675]MDF2159226.1 ABC transporter substrate-binding protein [Algoriphagus sp. CAU 1675]
MDSVSGLLYFEGLKIIPLQVPTSPSVLLYLLIISFLTSCSGKENKPEDAVEQISLAYAKGFSIYKGEGFWRLDVIQPWIGAEEGFSYLVLEEGIEGPEGDFDAVVQLPIERVVLTSTTQIPHLDLLGNTSALVGFPNLSLISSHKVWERIEAGKIKDLGSGPSANPEMILNLEPDWVMISTLGDDLRYLDLLQKAGVPCPINGEYVEQHPLGRAEWIKFTGVLLGKYEEAKAIFEGIESSYLNAGKLVENLLETQRPTVLSGVLYQDIWYAPGSESWGTEILENAGGNYVFRDQEGLGSLQLSYEFVLENAMDAEFWIGSADFEGLKSMGEAEPRYQAFEAFKSGEVYTYTGKKGPQGGLEYFELGYMRPDLVLKDLIKILHPELLPDYELYFYNQLDEKH